MAQDGKEETEEVKKDVDESKKDDGKRFSVHVTDSHHKHHDKDDDGFWSPNSARKFWMRYGVGHLSAEFWSLADKNKDGKIDKDELNQLLNDDHFFEKIKKDCNLEWISNVFEAFKCMDNDNNGSISKAEFTKAQKANGAKDEDIEKEWKLALKNVKNADDEKQELNFSQFLKYLDGMEY